MWLHNEQLSVAPACFLAGVRCMCQGQIRSQRVEVLVDRKRIEADILFINGVCFSPGQKSVHAGHLVCVRVNGAGEGVEFNLFQCTRRQCIPELDRRPITQIEHIV